VDAATLLLSRARAGGDPRADPPARYCAADVAGERRPGTPGLCGDERRLQTGELLLVIQEFCDPEIVFNNEAIVSGYPERGEWQGHEGLLRFGAGQTEAFQQMWLEPEEFIDGGDKVVIPLRLGGKARHSGIEIVFFVVHVVTFRDEKAVRIDLYAERTEALEAVGLGGDRT
jgi:ketosteroid isomerase-like protein